MSSQHVRISEKSHRVLKDLAKDEGETMQDVLDKAIESYRRAAFIREANAEYAVLRRNPDAWAEELRERGEWDKTVGDGQEGE